MSILAKDDVVAAELRRVVQDAQGWGSVRYTVKVLDVHDHQVDVEIENGADTGRVLMALPSSGR